MQEQLSVSAIAKRTGLDRRTIERALIELRHVSRGKSGGRESLLYDRDEAAQALADAHLDRSKVARLLPFGGSLSRLVAWNTAVRLVSMFQHDVATEYATWKARFGLTDDQAAAMGTLVSVMLAQHADDLMAEFDGHCPDTVSVDASLGVTGKNADRGAFMAAIGTTKRLQTMYAAGVEAVRRLEGRA